MTHFKPVTISNGSFAFCRIMVAVLLWVSVAFQIEWVVGLVFLIMLLSAILRVERAPLILLYKFVFDRIKQSATVIVDERGVYVSHLAGAAFSLICLVLLYFSNPTAAWIVTGAFAFLQTLAAFGFCSALKLYTCMAGGNCCRFGALAKKVKDDV
jgi:hypothetical protein